VTVDVSPGAVRPATTEAARPTALGRAVTAGFVTAAVGGCALAGLGHVVAAVTARRDGPWILGRAAGVTAFALLTALVLTGLVLAHPRAARWRRPRPRTRLALHAGLAAFTLAFTALHVAVLALDPYARVGWAGALVPFASAYRPLPVTLGVLGLYAGALAGVTAALAGRGAGRWWFPVHRVAAVSFVLVCLHGLFAGSDAAVLRPVYVAGAAAVAVLASTRYLARRT
jgi:DMSO/TMAO reductase YedYZ heme-binding membrane subunit